MHQEMASTLDRVMEDIARIKAEAATQEQPTRPRWPMIVLRSPKGWTGPKDVEGLPVEGTHRAHQVPIAGFADHPEHIGQLEAWLRSYRPEELFDDNGAPVESLKRLAPVGRRRMSANPHTNGGELLRALDLLDFREHAVDVPEHGKSLSEATNVLGYFLLDVMRANKDNFRLWARTRLLRTAWTRCFRQPAAPGWRTSSQTTTASRRTGA